MTSEGRMTATGRKYRFCVIAIQTFKLANLTIAIYGKYTQILLINKHINQQHSNSRT